MHKNIKIYYITEFLGALVFSTPIWTFFFTLHLGFSMGWAIFITTLSGFMNFLFEIPTGAWADRYGRKKLYITGVCIGIIGISFYLWAQNIYLFILSAIITGFASAIMSGNIEALIHDQLEEQGNEEEYNKVQTHGYFFFFSGRTFACLLGGFLYTIHPLFPYIGTMVCVICILPLLAMVKEPKQYLSQEKTDGKHIIQALLYIQKEKDLIYFIVAISLVSAIGNMYWFTYQPYLEKIGFSIPSVGFSFAIASIFSAIGSLILKRLQGKKYGDMKILQYLIFSLFISSVGFYIFISFPSLFGILPIILLSIAFGFTMSLGNNYIIGRVPKTHKSVSLSIFSFCITLGYFLFSGSIGFLSDQFSLKSVYCGIIVLIVCFLLLNKIMLRKISQHREALLIN